MIYIVKDNLGEEVTRFNDQMEAIKFCEDTDYNIDRHITCRKCDNIETK